MCSHCFTVTSDISRKLSNLIGMGLGFGKLQGFWWICFFRCQFFRIVSWDWAFWYQLVTNWAIGFHSLRNQGIPKIPQQPKPHGWPQKDLFKMGVTEEKTPFCLQSFGTYDQVWTSISPEKFAKTMGIILLDRNVWNVLAKRNWGDDMTLPLFLWDFIF